MSDFLLELLSEEIPARMQAKARNDLARLFAEELTKAGLSHEGIVTWSTPRRLALVARGVPGETEAVREELKGPQSSAPPQALDGFLRKTGLSREQLEERDGVLFAVIDKPGRAAAEVLGLIITKIIREFPWPKAMRWGPASTSMSALRWVRPLHSIVAIHGEEIVPIRLAWLLLWEKQDGDIRKELTDSGISSGATTLGHRFHHPGPITIGGASDYAEKLRACHVIVDHEERAAIVRDGAKAAAAAAGYALVEDEGLVVENAGLTEWPVPLLGTFDADYLDVPPEVIQLTARTNQKYFVMRGDEGQLAPAFVCTANIAANDDGTAIVEGNQRVLAARLSDARFFWEQDLKVPLDEQAAKLSGIVCPEKLGSVADKVERVAKLARWLVEEGIVKGADPAQAERAARLAKADLVTGMVGEFPELQGVIGGYLAAAQGETKAVSDAIRDHYKPVGQGDEVPTAPVTVAVSLADKLDSLIEFFAFDMAPTGSKDPFALRRAALGVISTAIANDINLSLSAAFRASRTAMGSIERTQARQALNDFFADRLKVQQREAGVRHDLIDAVFALGGEDDLVRLLARVTALQAFVETSDGADLLAGYKRAANILKKEDWSLARVMTSNSQGMPQTGEEDPLSQVEEPAIAQAVAAMAQGSTTPADAPAEEAALVAALDAAEPRVERAIAAEEFTVAMSALASLRAPIDAFFEQVTVNDPDPDSRARRLNLLARFRDAVHRVADFSRIEG